MAAIVTSAHTHEPHDLSFNGMCLSFTLGPRLVFFKALLETFKFCSHAVFPKQRTTRKVSYPTSGLSLTTRTCSASLKSKSSFLYTEKMPTSLRVTSTIPPLLCATSVTGSLRCPGSLSIAVCLRRSFALSSLM